LNFSRIKNIIFDLGGVIINIDVPLTYNALAKDCPLNAEEVRQKLNAEHVFGRYERGELSSAEVRKLLKDALQLAISDEELDRRWNALLLDIPQERIELIKKLRGSYRLYLLSNTNVIHIDEVNAILHRTSGISKLDELFDSIYYSFNIGLSKPSVEIYKHVLNHSGLDPSETLFLDDGIENVNGAIATGINAMQVTPDNSILEILKNAI